MIIQTLIIIWLITKFIEKIKQLLQHSPSLENIANRWKQLRVYSSMSYYQYQYGDLIPWAECLRTGDGAESGLWDLHMRWMNLWFQQLLDPWGWRQAPAIQCLTGGFAQLLVGMLIEGDGWFSSIHALYTCIGWIGLFQLSLVNILLK